MERLVLLLLVLVAHEGLTDPIIWMESSFVDTSDRGYVSVVCSATLSSGGLNAIQLVQDGRVLVKYARHREARTPANKTLFRTQGGVDDKTAFLVLRQSQVSLPFKKTFTCDVIWQDGTPKSQNETKTVNIDKQCGLHPSSPVTTLVETTQDDKTKSKEEITKIPSKESHINSLKIGETKTKTDDNDLSKTILMWLGVSVAAIAAVVSLVVFIRCLVRALGTQEVDRRVGGASGRRSTSMTYLSHRPPLPLPVESHSHEGHVHCYHARYMSNKHPVDLDPCSAYASCHTLECQDGIGNNQQICPA